MTIPAELERGESVTFAANRLLLADLRGEVAEADLLKLLERPALSPTRLRLLFETFARLIGVVVAFLAMARYLGGGWLGPAVTGLVFALGLVVAFLAVRWLSPRSD